MAARSNRPVVKDASSGRGRASVWVLFLLTFLCLAFALAISLTFHRHDALQDGELRARNLALLLGHHLTTTAGAIDTALSQLAVNATRVGPPTVENTNWDPMLEAAKAGLHGVAGVSVVDETGIVTHSTISAVVGHSRANNYLFRRLSSDPNVGLVTDLPYRGNITGQWVIPMGRRLVDRDGKFAGTIVATLEPERLRGFYRTVDVGSQGFVWVIHPEKFVLFREPSLVDPMGESARNNPLLTEQPDAPASGFMRARFEPQGSLYLSAFRHLTSPQLIIAISLSESEVLTKWRDNVILSGLIVTAFGLLLLFAARVITREIRARAGAEQRAHAQSERLASALERQERADAALRANQARFQSIMDHSPMMVSLKDLSGRFIFLNRAYVEFSGQSEESIIGRTIAELRPKEHSDVMESHDRAVVESQQALQWEMTLPKPDGPRTVLAVKFPVYDEAGKIISIGSILADITDQKRAESQIARAERIEAVGQLTGGIAHDFNNLLTSILLNADVMTSIVDQKTRPLVEAVRIAAERGADLTKRLLAFGRRQRLDPRPTDVKKLLTEMEPLMHRTLGEHIEIVWRVAADRCDATVDPGQLENAVINLAVNARDAMPNGGRLTIETSNMDVRETDAAPGLELKPGPYVVIAVHDSGTGMAPHVLEHAFEPFFTTKDVGKGTGLGLSMVYGFATQSGGQVRIQSKVGAGTVVRLYLPHSDAPSAAAEISLVPSPVLKTGKETILFVEDDPMVRTYTERQIARLGYRVVTAENAAHAIAQVEEGCTPDLLFTDVVMPGGTNGRQLALKLRQRWPDLRVLYTSGYAHGTLSIDGETVPNRYVLGKPYRASELADKLREVLDEPAVADVH